MTDQPAKHMGVLILVWDLFMEAEEFSLLYIHLVDGYAKLM